MDNITFDHRPLFNLEDEYNNSSSATNITFNVSEEAMMDGTEPILAEVFEIHDRSVVFNLVPSDIHLIV